MTQLMQVTFERGCGREIRCGTTCPPKTPPFGDVTAGDVSRYADARRVDACALAQTGLSKSVAGHPEVSRAPARSTRSQFESISRSRLRSLAADLSHTEFETLQSCVAALGGNLRVVADFGESTVELNILDIHSGSA